MARLLDSRVSEVHSLWDPDESAAVSKLEKLPPDEKKEIISKINTAYQEKVGEEEEGKEEKSDEESLNLESFNKKFRTKKQKERLIENLVSEMFMKSEKSFNSRW